MGGLEDKTAARGRLDREIRDEQADAAATFNYDLEQLSSALHEHARQHQVPWTQSSRKNWTTVTLAGHVSVSFGEHSDAYGRGGLTVTAGPMTAEFDPLPPAAALTALVSFLLTTEAGNTATAPAPGATTAPGGRRPRMLRTPPRSS